MLIVIFFAIGLHEYAHCKFADLAGDPTPRMYGRVTLNLTKHFDPMGTIAIILTQITGVGIGWGRPAPMTPSRMRNPKWDHFAAVAAGPISNLAQAVLFALVFRILARTGFLASVSSSGAAGEFFLALFTYGVLTNVSLFTFNLLPLGPLDGHWLVGILLPARAQAKWYLWQRQYGYAALLILVLLGQFTPYDPLGRVLLPVLLGLARFLLGTP